MVHKHGNNLATNLLRYYPFNGNSVDVVGGINGTDTDVVYLTSGKILDAAYFNGTNSKILIAPFTLVYGNEYTFSFWIKTKFVPGLLNSGLGGIFNSTINHYGFVNYSSYGPYQIAFSANSVTASCGVTNLGEWNHIILTVASNGDLQFYLNSNKSGTLGKIIANIDFDIFGYYGAYYSYLDVPLDEFGIWSRKLTQKDINDLYNGGRGVQYQGFRTDASTHILANYDTTLGNQVAYYKLDGNSNDSSGNGHNGTDTNITYSAGNGLINQGAGYTTSSTITVAPITELANSDKMSISFWVKSPDLLFPVFVYQAFGIDIRYDGTYQYGVHIKIWNAAMTDYALVRNQTLTLAPNNQFFHVVITYDGTQASDADKVKIYINGQQSIVAVAGAISIPTTLNALSQPLQIGSNLTGAMDEVSFYKQVLSPTNVTHLYNVGKSIQLPILRRILNHNHYVLDQIRNAKMAYSVRRLRTKYDGYCMRIRRSSDDVEMDIGFDYRGDIKISDMTSFIGIDDAYVVKWYDQSGNLIDAFQTDHDKQPIIAVAGILIVRNAKLALYSPDSTRYLEVPLTNLLKSYSLFGVMEFTAYGTEWLGGGGNNYGTYRTSGTVYHGFNSTLLGSAGAYAVGADNLQLNVVNLIEIHRINNIITNVTNGISTPMSKISSGANEEFLINNLHGETIAYGLQGYLQETIAYDKDISDKRAIVYGDMKKYYG